MSTEATPTRLLRCARNDMGAVGHRPHALGRRSFRRGLLGALGVLQVAEDAGEAAELVLGHLVGVHTRVDRMLTMGMVR